MKSLKNVCDLNEDIFAGFFSAKLFRDHDLQLNVEISRDKFCIVYHRLLGMNEKVIYPG